MKTKTIAMEKAKWMFIAMLLFTQARAQAPTSNESQDKTAKLSFRSVYETNQYYNDLEESVELKYTNLKVTVFEEMERPQDSLWLINEQINTFKELIRMEEFNFISWEKKADRADVNFQKERLEKQEFAKNEIIKMRKQIDELETRKPSFVKELKQHQVELEKIDRQQEKELERVKLDREAALVKMYRS